MAGICALPASFLFFLLLSGLLSESEMIGLDLTVFVDLPFLGLGALLVALAMEVSVPDELELDVEESDDDELDDVEEVDVVENNLSLLLLFADWGWFPGARCIARKTITEQGRQLMRRKRHGNRNNQ